MSMGKNGTISKLTDGKFELSKDELEMLWEQHNKTLNELQVPSERFTRYTSDLIKKLRDVSEQLILSGAIPNLTRKDTAAYVWKQLKSNNIAYPQSHFYKYFDSEQKRDWQTTEEKPTPTIHEHSFLLIENHPTMGEIKRCDAPCDPPCRAMMIDGRLFEEQMQEESEPELKPSKEKTTYEEKHQLIIDELESSALRLKAMANVWKNQDSNLTESEMRTIHEELFYVRKAGEFLDMAYDKKNLIHPFIQHLMALAYAETTQNHAGGKFLMYRIDLATRRHAEAVKFFKDEGQFAKLLTEKQSSKAMAAKIRKLHPRYQPPTELKSQNAGFSGQKCSNCGKRRVGDDREQDPDWKKGDPANTKYRTVLRCFDCWQTQRQKFYKLPKENPKIQVQWDSRELTETERIDYIKFKKDNKL